MEIDFDWTFEEENTVKRISLSPHLKLLVSCKSTTVSPIWASESEVRKHSFQNTFRRSYKRWKQKSTSSFRSKQQNTVTPWTACHRDSRCETKMNE